MSETVVTIALLLPLAAIITYYDVRYRRIPNAFVLATLTAGVAINGIFGGLPGIAASFMGCGLGFVLMFMLHIFAAIGAVTGAALVVPTFVVVILTGGLLAVVSIVRAGAVMPTMHRVLQIFVGMLPGWQMPKFAVPTDRKHTIPYGVAITMGSIISMAIFRT